MKIALASDHAGYNYKEKIKEHLQGKGHETVDYGTHSTEPVDYPVFIRQAARAVADGECERAVVLGGSGNGEAMAANRHRGSVAPSAGTRNPPAWAACTTTPTPFRSASG